MPLNCSSKNGNVMLREFHFKEKERGTAGAGEASGKAGQV